MCVCAGIVISMGLALALCSPVPLPDSQECVCSSAARSLLSALTHIMEKEGKMMDQDLFAGFNCTDLEAQMIPHTHTSSVCQPAISANSSCSGHRSSNFSEVECVKNIRGDLRYYDLLLNSYRPSTQELSPVMMANTQLINCLNQKCESAEGVFPQWRVWRGSSFDDRVSLCKTLKGFTSAPSPSTERWPTSPPESTGNDVTHYTTA
ncbi:LOW QUALITY PROTEIN: interleukin-12 subunit alpha [Danio aesculapii]|uniref:LOW QUALITY PROTEIN: interleukin-12 subunit alpha n=1 Tax=Danio aesculapii TaxID=1142201 RepID=UPI0024C036DE|nr:LOW QUALITY PROTEIN: interleukin-12 subunit alpha [Danio aesculapii]